MSYRLNLTLTARITCLLLFSTFFSFESYGQYLVKSRKSSYYTYIYKLTGKQAEQIYKGDLKTEELDSTFFTNLVDKYPTDSIYNKMHTKVELMYFPTFYANEEIKKVEIGGVSQ